jgi:NADH-quinone oxidoreductase subunit N
MVVGTVGALVQTDMKRVLGYSSIAHAGFILTGVVALNQAGVTAVLFYLLVYGAATIGAFGVVWLVRERSVSADGSGGAILGEATHLSQWAGLGRSNPLLALTFALFLLSFAGIPLTAGFAGKFAVFSAAIEGGAWPLALIGVLSSSAAAFFYVRIIVLMFFTEPAGSPESAESAGEGAATVVPAGVPLDVPVELPADVPANALATAVEVRPAATTTTTVVGTEGFAAVAIAVCAATTVILGVAPSWLLDLIGSVAQFLP